MNSLFTLSYWINLRPGSLTLQFQRNMVIFLVILVILTFIFALFKSRHRKSLFNRIWRKSYSFSVSNLVIGLFLLFFFYEAIPFLSARFWLLLWGLGMMVWLFFIGKILVKIPKIRQKIKEEKEFRKYIP